MADVLVPVSTRISPDTYARLQAIAASQERTISQVVRSAIEGYNPDVNVLVLHRFSAAGGHSWVTDALPPGRDVAQHEAEPQQEAGE